MGGTSAACSSHTAPPSRQSQSIVIEPEGAPAGAPYRSGMREVSPLRFVTMGSARPSMVVAPQPTHRESQHGSAFHLQQQSGAVSPVMGVRKSAMFSNQQMSPPHPAHPTSSGQTSPHPVQHGPTAQTGPPVWAAAPNAYVMNPVKPTPRSSLPISETDSNVRPLDPGRVRETRTSL